jgi:hypothetical protein
MSNVIEFLERMGQDAQLRHATHTNIEKELVSKHIEPMIRSAILAKDSEQIEALLGVNNKLCCLVYAVEKPEEYQFQASKLPSSQHSVCSIAPAL